MIGIQFGLSLVFFVLFIGYFLTTETRRRMRLSVWLTLALTGLCLSSLFTKDDAGAWKVRIKPGLDLRGGRSSSWSWPGIRVGRPWIRRWR